MNSSRSTYIPLFIGIFPLLVFHLTHFLSARAGLVPWCIPYWDGCTSISATGRSGSAFILFKVTMLPTAAVLMLYWLTTWNKIHRLMTPGQFKPWIQWLGILAAVFLAMYTVALGLEGNGFQLQRRVGIIFFFTFTYLCQLLFTYQLGHLGLHDWTHRWQVMLCTVILCLGLLTLVLDWQLDNYDDYEDAFEWIITLLLQCYFILSYWAWKIMDSTAGLQRSP
ncbi:MAG: hypothetical protein WD772_08535 [Pseudohongiellaceae bacterium]